MARVVGIKCTAHCSKCGQHFHSTAAFDAHIRGKYRPKPGERGRYCVHAEDAADKHGRDLFILLTDSGVCTLNHTGRAKNVTIWTLRSSYSRITSINIWDAEDANPTEEEIEALPLTTQPTRRVRPPGPRKRRRLRDVR